jgi:Zn-dependent protease with chaperone function
MDGAAPAGRLIRLDGEARELDCPSCGARIVHDRAFVAWCAACEWNVDAGQEPAPTGRIARTYERLNRREGESLYRQLLGSQALRPRFGVAAALAILLSVAVFAGWALLVAAGVAILVGSSFIVGQLVGVFLLGLAFVARPRIERRPKGALASDAAPELYRLVDDLAARLEAPRVHALVLRPDWNAATFRYGLRQRHALEIGLPLWAALAPDERIALLGHEVAHGVNGDTLRGVVAWNAVQTLAELGNVIVPDRVMPETGDGFVDLAAVPVNLLFLGVALLLYAAAGVVISLTFRDGRRAEFYADRLAGSLAGTEAAVRMLGTVRLERAYQRALANAQTGLIEGGLWPELAHQLRVTPPGEVDRLRRAEQRAGSGFFGSHPPLYQRERLLEVAPSVAPGFLINADRMDRIDAELAGARERLDTLARRRLPEPDDLL